jgi:hypothetical protein
MDADVDVDVDVDFLIFLDVGLLFLSVCRLLVLLLPPAILLIESQYG